MLNLAENEDTTNKVQIILNELYPNENVDVPDPYWDDQRI
jgi:protein-tyrosine phosphatase